LKHILYISRWWTGLITQSSPLAPTQPGRADALFDGLNVELTNAETLKRRPGNDRYCSQTVDKPLGFYAFRNIAGTTKLLTDNAAKVQTFTTNAVTDVFTKGTTAKTRFQSVANAVYMCNGTDAKKWNGTTVSGWGITTPSAALTLAFDYSSTHFPTAAAGTNWTNPNNALTTNATYAVYNTTTQDLLKLTTCAFSLPASIQVNGFAITVIGNGSSATSAQRQIQVGVTKDGTTLAGAWQTITLNQTSDTTTVVGGSTNMLGVASATKAEVENSTFGIVVRDADTTAAALNIDSVSITVYYSVPAGLTLVSGARYVFSFVNSATGHVSTASAVSASTGVLTNKQVTVSGTGSGDAQVDKINIYRTLDGGSLFYFLAQISNPGASTFNYTDTTADSGLNDLISAPINHSNDPVPAGASNVAFHMGRLWVSVSNKVYFSGGPDTIVGVPEEAWPPAYVFVFPGAVTAMASTGQGLIVATATDLFIIRGYDTFSFFSQKLLANFGVVDQDCVAQDGDLLFVYTANRQLFSLSDSLTEIGFLVGNYLKANFDPALSYLKLHRHGDDSGLFLSNGSDKVMRFNVARGIWCPTGQPEGGVGAIASVGVDTSDFRLLMGRAADGGYILYRNPDSNLDDGALMSSAYATVGTIVAAPPGDTTELSAVLVEAKAVGAAPGVSVLLNEIDGVFTPLPNPVADPPTLSPALSVRMQRHYLKAAQKPLPQRVRHLQVKVTFPVEDAANELLGLAFMPPA